MINIIFNYIFGLTLQSKSEFIIFIIFLFSKNVFASANIIYNQSLYPN